MDAAIDVQIVPLRDRRSRRDLLHRALQSLAALRLGADPAQIAVRREASGRPVIDGCSVSLAYARDLAVCALGPPGLRLGIDCEPEDRAGAEELAALIMSPHELARLAPAGAAARRRAIVRRWTECEAVAKALGLGMRAVLTRDPGAGLTVCRVSIPGHAAALAFDDGRALAVRPLRPFALNDEEPMVTKSELAPR